MRAFWVVIDAFVSLPPDSVGFKGWFKPCTLDNIEHIQQIEDTEPISFTLGTLPVTNPSIFVFRDITLMLNF